MRLAQQVLDIMHAEQIGPAPALTFSSDDQHGWRRLGNGFTYADSDGSRPSPANFSKALRPLVHQVGARPAPPHLRL